MARVSELEGDTFYFMDLRKVSGKHFRIIFNTDYCDARIFFFFLKERRKSDEKQFSFVIQNSLETVGKLKSKMSSSEWTKKIQDDPHCPLLFELSLSKHFHFCFTFSPQVTSGATKNPTASRRTWRPLE